MISGGKKQIQSKNYGDGVVVFSGEISSIFREKNQVKGSAQVLSVVLVKRFYGF